MKNGTCAGPDKINAELLKNGPPELYELITKLLAEAWITNTVPTDWLTTNQVPLPKTPHPRTVDDFRRITISSAMYKVYATFLMQQLQRYLPDISSYQAGFLPNRSTDDHVFTLRRLCEERWRMGLPTFILSIDLRKAFDMVNTHALGPALHEKGVPAYLVNRIIGSILHEQTFIRWGGKCTNVHSRAKGVKQGCPTSILLRVSETTKLDLNLLNFDLPLLLAYADDLIVVGDSLNSLERPLAALITELQAFGLTINEKKCSILIRDPLQLVPPTGNITVTYQPASKPI